MGSAVKKTISLPPELAKEAEDTARAKETTLSTVIQGVLRLSRAARMKNGLRNLQDYWSRMAKQKGIMTEKDLERFLRE